MFDDFEKDDGACHLEIIFELNVEMRSNFCLKILKKEPVALHRETVLK